MASILNRGGLAFVLIVLVIISSSFKTTTVADARNPHSLARQLATDCEDDPVQSDIPGCTSGGGSSKSGPPSGRVGGRAPGSSRCRRGRCCGRTKMGACICCN